MNQIFVYVKAEAGRKIFVGTFKYISTIQEDVMRSLILLKLEQYKNKTFMLIGTETFQIRF